jgi:3-hydroxybutyrate dehydrogenase
MLNGFDDTATIDARHLELRELGISAAYHVADLRDPAQFADLIQTTTAMHGSFDILVTTLSSATASPSRTSRPSIGTKRSQSTSPHRSIPSALALSGMRASGCKRIINMASVYDWFATVGRADCITTKTALIGLTRAVALEAARTAITCNAICPGTVLTPAIERLQNEMQRDGIARDQEAQFLDRRQPSRRFVPDSNVAGLIVFLCSPHAADIMAQRGRSTAPEWNRADAAQLSSASRT